MPEPDNNGVSTSKSSTIVVGGKEIKVDKSKSTQHHQTNPVSTSAWSTGHKTNSEILSETKEADRLLEQEIKLHENKGLFNGIGAFLASTTAIAGATIEDTLGAVLDVGDWRLPVSDKSELSSINSIFKFIDNTIGDGENEVGNFLTRRAAHVREVNEKVNKVNTSSDTFNYLANGSANLVGNVGGFVLSGGPITKGLKAAGLAGKANTVASAWLFTQSGSIPIAQGVYEKSYESFIHKASPELKALEAKAEAEARKKYTDQYGEDDPWVSFSGVEDAVIAARKEVRDEFAKNNPNIHKEAQVIASNGADASIKMNATSFFLNLTSAKLFMTGKNLSTRNLLDKPFLTKGALSESGQEFLEEGVTENISEKYGLAVGQGKDYGLSDAMGDVLSMQALEQGLWGAAGGGGQTLGTNFLTRKDRQEQYDKQQESIKRWNEISAAAGQGGDVISNLTSLLSTSDNIHQIIKEQNKLMKEGKRKEANALADKIVTNQALHAFKTGTTEKLLEVYNDLATHKDTSDAERKTAFKAIKEVKELETIYNDIQNSGALNTQTLFYNRANDKALNQHKADLENKIILKRAGVDKAIKSAINRGETTLKTGVRYPMHSSPTGTIEEELEYDLDNLFTNKYEAKKPKETYDNFMKFLTDTNTGVQEAKEYGDLQAALEKVNESIDANNTHYNKFTSSNYQKSLKEETKLAKKINNAKLAMSEARSDPNYEKFIDRFLKPYKNKILPERLDYIKSTLMNVKVKEDTKKKEQETNTINNIVNETSTKDKPTVIATQQPVSTSTQNTQPITNSNAIPEAGTNLGTLNANIADEFVPSDIDEDNFWSDIESDEDVEIPLENVVVDPIESNAIPLQTSQIPVSKDRAEKADTLVSVIEASTVASTNANPQSKPSTKKQEKKKEEEGKPILDQVWEPKVLHDSLSRRKDELNDDKNDWLEIEEKRKDELEKLKNQRPPLLSNRKKWKKKHAEKIAERKKALEFSTQRADYYHEEILKVENLMKVETIGQAKARVTEALEDIKEDIEHTRIRMTDPTLDQQFYTGQLNREILELELLEAELSDIQSEIDSGKTTIKDEVKDEIKIKGQTTTQPVVTPTPEPITQPNNQNTDDEGDIPDEFLGMLEPDEISDDIPQAALDAIGNLTEDYYESLKDDLGREPTFEEFIRDFIRHHDKTSADKFFNGLIKGWELNNYKSTNYKAVYNDIFRNRKEIGSDLMTALSSIVTSPKQLSEETDQVIAEVQGNVEEQTPTHTADNEEVFENAEHSGFVTSETEPKLAFLNKLHTATLNEETGALEYRYTEDELNQGQYADANLLLLHPDKYNKGTKLNINIPENRDHILVPVYNGDGTKGEAMSFGQWVLKTGAKEGSKEWLAKVPMMITDAEGNKLALVHDVEWYHPARFGDATKIPEARANTRNIRQAVYSNNGAKIKITQKRGGTFAGMKLGFGKDGKRLPSIKLSEANPQAEIGTATDKGELIVNGKPFKKRILNNPKKGFERGKVYDIRRYGTDKKGEPTYMAFPLFQRRLTPESVQSVIGAIRIFMYQKNNNVSNDKKEIVENARKKLLLQTGLDINNYKDLESYIGRFVYTFSAKATTSVDKKAKAAADAKAEKAGKKVKKDGSLEILTDSDITPEQQIANQVKANPKIKHGQPWMSITPAGTVIFGVKGEFLKEGREFLFMYPGMLSKNNNAVGKIKEQFKFLEKTVLPRYSQNVSRKGLESSKPLVQINGIEPTVASRNYTEYLMDTLETNIKSHNIGTEEEPMYVTRMQPIITYELDTKQDENKAEPITPENVGKPSATVPSTQEVTTLTPVKETRADIEKQRQEEINEEASRIKTKREYYTAINEDGEIDNIEVTYYADGKRDIWLVDKNGKRQGSLSSKFKVEVPLEKILPAGTESHKLVSTIDVALEENKVVRKINAKYDAKLEKIEPNPQEDAQVVEEAQEKTKEDFPIVNKENVQGKYGKPFRQKNDKSGLVEIETVVTEDHDTYKIKFKTQTTNTSGESREQNYKNYNNVEELIEDLGITDKEDVENLKTLTEDGGIIAVSQIRISKDDGSSSATIVTMAGKAEFVIDAKLKSEESPVYTPEEIQKTIEQAEEDLKWLGADDLMFEPSVIEEDQVKNMLKDMLLIEGIQPHHLYKLTDFIFNQLATSISFDKGSKVDKATLLGEIDTKFKEILKPIKEQYKQRQKILASAKDNERAKALVERYNKAFTKIKTIENNSDKINDSALAKINKYTGITETKSDDDTEAPVDEANRVRNFSQTSLEENGKTTSSYRLKRFFAGIQDKNLDGSGKVGFLNIPEYVPFDDVYNTLAAILAESQPNFDSMMAILKSYDKAHPWINSVISKLQGADNQIKNEFVSTMAKHSLDMEFVMYSSNRDGNYTLKVYNTNANAITRNIRDNWKNSFKNGNLVKVVSGVYEIDKEEAKKVLSQYMAATQEPDYMIGKFSKFVMNKSGDVIINDKGFIKSFKKRPVQLSIIGNKVMKVTKVGDNKFNISTHTPAVTESLTKENLISEDADVQARVKQGKEFIKSWLNNFGIELSDGTIDDLISNGLYHNGKRTEFQKLFEISDNTEGFFGLLASKLVNFIGAERTSFEDEGGNPIVDTVFKSLAKLESKYTRHRVTNSFRDGGKAIYGFTVSKFITDRVRDLRAEDSTVRDQLGEISFSQDSLWLQLLKDPKFREKFQISHLGVTAMKEFGKKLFGDNNDLSSLSDADHELTKLGAFMDTTQGQQATTDGEIDLRIARMFSPTMSDKTTMTMIKTAVLDLRNKHINIEKTIEKGMLVDTTIDPTNELMEVLYEQLVLPELKRIVNFRSTVKSTDIKNYDKGAGLFLQLPQLNSIQLPSKDGSQVDLVKAIAARPDHFTVSKVEELAKAQMMNVVKGYIGSLVAGKLASWESNGYVTKNPNGAIDSAKFFDAKYLRKFTGDLDTQVKLAATDFVINSLISNANAFMAIAGDPAVYFKSKSKDYVQISKDTFVNVGKRLANQIAPGSKLADSNNNKYIQIFVNDRITVSENIDFLTKLLDNKKFDRKQWNKIQAMPRGDARDKAQETFYGRYPKSNAYFEIEGTDAQEYTTWKEHLYVLEKMGRTPDIASDITPEDIRVARELFESGTPLDQMTDLQKKVMKMVMQPIKPVYTGQQYDVNQDVMRTVYIKSSSFPLIPQVTQGLELDKLRLSMEKLEKKGKTVRASYQTANKVGALSSALNLFNNDGTIREFTNDDLTAASLILDRSNFRIQLDVPFKSSKKKEDTVTLGTQTMKLLFGDGIMNLTGFLYEGKPMNGKDLYQEYTDTFNHLIKHKRQELYDELGIDSKTGLPLSAEATAKKLQKILKEEAEGRGYPKQDIEALTLQPITNNSGDIVDYEFTLPLWGSANSNRYESLLNAIVTNRIAKVKMPGNSYIAGSEEGFKAQKGIEGLSTEQQSKIVFTSAWQGDLKAAKYDEDGNLMQAQILVPSKFRTNDGKLFDLFKKKDGEYLYVEESPNGWKLKEDMVDSDLLSITSFRIPTSGHVSMSQFEIVGILPFEVGDLLIVPKNMTTQKGLDFDVDKETTYQLWHMIQESGKLIALDEEYKLKDLDKEMKSLKAEMEEEFNYDQMEADIVEAKAKIDRSWKNQSNRLQKLYDQKKSQEEIISQVFHDVKELELVLDSVHGDLASANKDLKIQDEAADKLLGDIFGVDITEEINAEIASLETKRGEVNTALDVMRTKLKKLSEGKLKDKDLKERVTKRKERQEKLLVDFHAKINAKKNKIASKRQAKNKLKVLKKIYPKVLQNKIVRLHKSVLTNPNKKMQKRINKVLSINYAKEQAELIDGWIQGQKDSAYFTPLSDEYQKEKVFLGASGKIGTGAYSLDVVGHSLFNQSSNLGKPLSLTQTIDRKIVPFEVSFGDIKSKGELGREFTLGANGGDGKRSISEVLAERQNIATDNEKEQVMGRVNLNSLTLDVDKVLNMLGFDMDEDGNSISMLFLSQPIINDYVRELANANSNIAEYNPDKEQELMVKLLNKYGGKELSHEEMKQADVTMTGANLALQIQGNEDPFMQAAVLQKFIKLREYGEAIRKVQTSINVDSKGIGKSTFDAIEKLKKLEDLASNDKIRNTANIIGDYVHINEVTPERHKELLEEGYIRGNQYYMKPETVMGAFNIYTLTTANKLWSKYFPYDSLVANNLFDELNKIMLDSEASSGKVIDTKQHIFQELKKYIYADSRTGLYSGTAQEERHRLFIDTEDKRSLASYIKAALKLNGDKIVDNKVKTNKLISRFEFDIETNGQPSKIKFNNAASENFDEEFLYNSLLELIENPLPLPDFNNETYNTRKLAQDLINYSILEGGVQQAIQFMKFVPVSYLNEMGFSGHLRNVDFNNNSSLFNLTLGKDKGQEHFVSRFTMQYAQHNPNKMPKLGLKAGAGKEGGWVNQAKSISDAVYDGKEELGNLQKFSVPKKKGETPKTFLSIYNPKIPKGQKKFQLYYFNGKEYTRVPVLGVFGMNEYAPRATMFPSLANEVGISTPKMKVQSAQHTTNTIVPNSLVSQVHAGNLETIMQTIAQSDFGDVSITSNALLPYMDSSVKVVVVPNLPGKAAYHIGTNTIYVKASTISSSTPQELARTMLKEYTHSITAKELAKYVSKDGRSLSEGAPKHITALFRLFKAAEKHFGKEIEDLRNRGREKGVTKREKESVYGAYDIFEFVEMMFTQPEFQQEMNTIKYKATGKTYFERFKQLVVELLSTVMGENLDKQGITHQAIDLTITMLEDVAARPQEKSPVTKQDRSDVKLLKKTDDQLNLFEEKVITINLKQSKTRHEFTNGVEKLVRDNADKIKQEITDTLKNKILPLLKNGSDFDLIYKEFGNIGEKASPTLRKLSNHITGSRTSLAMKGINMNDIDTLSYLGIGIDSMLSRMAGLDSVALNKVLITSNPNSKEVKDLIQRIENLPTMKSKGTNLGTLSKISDEEMMGMVSNLPKEEVTKAEKIKSFNPNDKVLKKGSVVSYNSGRYLFWGTTKSGAAQLIKPDGTKFSGTPSVDKLSVKGAYKTTVYNNIEYVVTDNNNVYSGATGKLVYTGNDQSSKAQKQRIIDSALAPKQNIDDGFSDEFLAMLEPENVINKLSELGILNKKCKV